MILIVAQKAFQLIYDGFLAIIITKKESILLRYLFTYVVSGKCDKGVEEH